MLRSILKGYPDILNVKQVSEILGVSTKTVYRLIRDETIISMKIGREFRVPKVNLIQYLRVVGSPERAQATC